jgi:hypothetical protein
MIAVADPELKNPQQRLRIPLHAPICKIHDALMHFSGMLLQRVVIFAGYDVDT